MYDHKNICCVWYPSGGFGHFINAVLTLHGVNFVTPDQKQYEFSANGNSHSSQLTAPKFCVDTTDYCFDFDLLDNKYVVLVDTGIDNESKNFVKQLPSADIIKVSYSAESWPIVAYTCIHKAMNSSMEHELAVDPHAWPQLTDWSQREKYFLFLVQHHYRNMWKPDPDCHNLLVDHLLNYDVFRHKLSEFGIETTDFTRLWNQWFNHNRRYLDPVMFAKQVIESIVSGRSMDLSDCDDLWTQAVTNYFIWDKFNYTVPANDYAAWFSNTDQIRLLLSQNHALHKST